MLSDFLRSSKRHNDMNEISASHKWRPLKVNNSILECNCGAKLYQSNGKDEIIITITSASKGNWMCYLNEIDHMIIDIMC